MFRTCCEWLQADIDAAGQQGLGVVAMVYGATRRLQIQARAFTPAQEAALDAANRAHDSTLDRIMTADGRSLPIKTLVTCGLFFCPYCGHEIASLIDGQKSAFDELVERHKMFVTVR